MSKFAQSAREHKFQSESPADAWQWRLTSGLVVGLAALLFFARLGTRALWASENRWGEIAREMIVTSNYFWPTINGRLYFDKPLLSYWLIVGATPFTGIVDELAARIPSATAGLLAVIFLMALTWRLCNGRIATLAGFILATSFSFVFFSRHASADVETIAGELGALVLFERYQQKNAGGPWVIGLWLIMSVTSMTKGLLGFVLPILVIAAFSCIAEGQREFLERISAGGFFTRIRWLIGRNRWLFNWYSLLAVPLGIAIYLAPFLISQVRMHSNAGIHMVIRENLVRFFHPFDHRGSVYLYFYVIFILMAPWSVFLPAALAQLHFRSDRKPAAERGDRFALAFFWTTFVFFTLSRSRRSYYLLPILPAAAILVARLLDEPTASLIPAARHLRNLGYAVLVLCVIGGVGVLLPQSIRPKGLAILPPAPDRMIFAILWLLSLASVAWAAVRFEPRRICHSACIVAYLAMVYFFIFAQPGAERYRGEKAFARAVVERVGNNFGALALYNDQGPMFYLRPQRPLPVYSDARSLADTISRREVRWLITRQRDVATIGPSAVKIYEEQTYPWDGQEHRLNRQVLLRILP